MTTDTIDWLLGCDEPWTRYRTLVDLLDRTEDDPEVRAARCELLAHPLVKGLVDAAAAWPGYAIKRHNDAAHPIHKLGTISDFGLRVTDPGVRPMLEVIMSHQGPEGAFLVPLNVARAFGGTGEDLWTWVLCDAPTTLHALLAMGLGDDPRVQRAVDHLVGLAHDSGFGCVAAPDLGRFRGPGRKADPCPIANVCALKALLQVPRLRDSPAARAAAEMLLWHWERRGQQKLYLFGIGSDFRKLKYPFVWYDILHVTDVLSQVPAVRSDPRFREMVVEIAAQADGNGRYTAGSMYQAWKGWSFADKRTPSPWLTLLALRIQSRMGEETT